MYELVLKMQTVQRRLIKKTETVISREVQLRDLERINAELKKRLTRRPGPEVGERLSRFRDVVKGKSNQIKASHVCMLNNCLQWLKASLRTSATADIVHLFHDCCHTLSVKRGVKRPSRFTGNM